MDRFTEAARKLRLTADGIAEPDADIGPMISEAGRETVRQHIDDARQRGATILIGGAAPDDPKYSKGFF